MMNYFGDKGFGSFVFHLNNISNDQV